MYNNIILRSKVVSYINRNVEARFLGTLNPYINFFEFSHPLGLIVNIGV